MVIRFGKDLYPSLTQAIEDFRNYFKPDKEKTYFRASHTGGRLTVRNTGEGAEFRIEV